MVSIKKVYCTEEPINGVKAISMGFNGDGEWEVVIKLLPIKIEFIENL